MDKSGWIRKIKKCSKEAGTYQPFFDPVIETLGGILEKRDAAQEQFEALGGKIIVKHTNKGGATNLTQNPALRAVNDLNRDALAYWRDLGLTPSGFKKLTDVAISNKEESSKLEKALNEISKELGKSP